jgi:hypothetical protein
LLHHFDWETVPTVSALTRTHHVSFSHFLKLTMPEGNAGKSPTSFGAIQVRSGKKGTTVKATFPVPGATH